MGNPEDWKRKIREIEGKRNHGSQLAARRLAHLETELAAYENRVKTEVAEFASSEEARFIQRELGRPGRWRRDGMVPTNQGTAPSKKYFPPPNVLVIHNLFVHRDDERVYAFSGLGFTEFYRSVSFWIGLSVPARSWAFGDGMSGRTTTPHHFASSYVRSQYPGGAEGMLIADGSTHGTSANDPRWDTIAFDDWLKRVPNWSRSGIVDSIQRQFSGYLEAR